MIAGRYLGSELRRRWSRTFVTALGLAAGVGVVMGIIGVSDGLSQAQNQVLSPLSSVGTDIIVTRTVAATSSTSSSSSASAPGSDQGRGGFFGGPGGLGGQSAAQLQQLNNSDAAALLNANSSVLTDLSKLGPPGTKFTHDFFIPGTLITFPQAAVAEVASVRGVQSAVPGLSLEALHEAGTVPQVVDTVTTGGQTVQSVQRPSPLTDAERQAVFDCIRASGGFGPPSPGATPGPRPGGPDEGRFGGVIQKCLPARYQQYVAQVVVPAQTITRILNPPATDTQTKTYTAAAVDPSDRSSGLITAAQVTAGSWFSSQPGNEVLVNTAYANRSGIKVGQFLPIDGVSYRVVGLVAPTLTGNISDLYFDIRTLQSLSSNSDRVNEVLVKVRSADSVDAVAAAIHARLPGAQVLTAKTLADQVSGSLADARSLAASLGTAAAVIILLAAFLIAALLTTSSVAKRVREIGTLRAVGWGRGRVVRQIVAETFIIGLLGAGLGVLVGLGAGAAVNLFGPTLTATTSGVAVGASTLSSLFHQSTGATASQSVHLQALISVRTVLLGVLFAVIGGLLAGALGGWRASRLSPADALRDLG